MTRNISGFIGENYDGFATIGKNNDNYVYSNNIIFNDFMYEIANKSNSGYTYEKCKNLGETYIVIPNCNISMYFSKQKISLQKAKNKVLNCLIGCGTYFAEQDAVGYSEYTITGYDLVKCELGGHNLNDILLSHVGEYVNIEVTVD